MLSVKCCIEHDSTFLQYTVCSPTNTAHEAGGPLGCSHTAGSPAPLQPLPQSCCSPAVLRLHNTARNYSFPSIGGKSAIGLEKLE